MALLLAFIICVIVGQSISLGLGLMVERYSTPYTGLHGELVCHVLDRLARCGPHHRTALAPGPASPLKRGARGPRLIRSSHSNRCLMNWRFGVEARAIAA
jgi:hypothetical protein